MSVVFAPDTASYVSLNSFRPPLFPTALWLNRMLFDTHYVVFHVVYLAFTIIMCLALDNWLRKQFNVSRLFVCLLVAALTIPVYIFYKYGHMLLSETLSIPLFVFTFMAFSKFCLKRTVKSAVVFSVLTALLIFTRAQFYYIYSFFVLGVLWLMIQKTPKAVVFKVALVFLASVVLTNGINRVYHYALNGKLGVSAAVGLQIAVQPLYLAHADDSKHIQDPQARHLFSAAYARAKQQGLLPLAGQRMKQKDFYYTQNYDHLMNQYQAVLSSDHITNLYHQSNLLTHLAWGLFKANPVANITFYIARIYFALGQYMSFFMICALLWMCVQLLKGNRSPLVVQVTICLLMAIANLMFVTIFEPALTRYMVYSYVPIFIAFILLVQNVRMPPLTDNKQRD